MRILCVDDENLVRIVTADLLRELGHEVIEAGGGAEAINRIEQCGTEIDMLITDLQMPGGFGGRHVAEMARASHPGLPIIYFTAYSAMEPGDAPGTKLLRKPCSIGSLERAIESLRPQPSRFASAI